MKAALVMSVYNRPDLLERTLASLRASDISVSSIHVVDDGSSDPEVFRQLMVGLRGMPVRVERTDDNLGYARQFNRLLRQAFASTEVDFVISMDSDVEVGPRDWQARMISFMAEHPEVGIAAPDKPGCYLRLHRNGYDEVEWAVSICYVVSRAAYAACTHGELWLDESLDTSWDPDFCYRVRREGYRVALVPGTSVTDLGEGKSTISAKLGRGNYTFNAKWNRQLLGRFVYKSPMMLKWEEYPLNAKFRQMMNVQQGTYRVDRCSEPLCGHASELVATLACEGNSPSAADLRRLIEMDVSVVADQPFESISPDLVAGRRHLAEAEDLAPFSLHREAK